MKIKYVICIIVIGIIFLFLSWLMSSSLLSTFPWVDDLIQMAAVFVALFASIIALSTSDPPLKKIKIDVDTSISGSRISSSKTELPNDIANQFIDLLGDKLTSQQIHFTMKNSSGFTLSNPTLTFRFPNNCQHPHKEGGIWIVGNNSNLYNSQKDLKKLEFGDTIILSNSNLPYWNKDETITIWIRMLLERIQESPFEVGISVNCQKAESYIVKVPISSKLLNHKE